MRMIDADWLHDAVSDTYGHGDSSNVVIWFGDVLSLIDAAPTLSAVPVVHGRWELERAGKYKQIEHYSCSICGFDLPYNPEYLPEYCEHCGAKMDGGDGHVPEPPEVE